MKINSLARKPQSLTPYLILAVIAHSIFLWMVKFPPSAPMKLPITFDVRITSLPVAERHIELEPNNTNSDEPPSISTTIKKQNPQTTSIRLTTIDAQATTDLPTATISISPNAITSKAKVTTENLLESAHRIAMEDAKNMPKSKDDGILLSERAFSPKLAQALAKKEKVAGVTQYTDGMVKVVTSSGAEYCMQLSPLLVKGAFDSDPIPMTCP